jgi:hypothetical protein
MTDADELKPRQTAFGSELCCWGRSCTGRLRGSGSRITRSGSCVGAAADGAGGSAAGAGDRGADARLGVIAYAGIPLTTPDDEVLGSFCAIDNKPRIWTKADLDVLNDFAQSAIAYIDQGGNGPGRT